MGGLIFLGVVAVAALLVITKSFKIVGQAEVMSKLRASLEQGTAKKGARKRAPSRTRRTSKRKTA